jgi:hypothetical protein
VFDISCFYNTQEFSTIPNDAYNYWSSSYWLYDPSVYSESHNATVYGTFYSSQQNGVLIPVWNLTYTGSYADQYADNSDAVIIAQEVISVSSSNDTYNVDWAEYKTSSGGWATTIYSVDTVGGQPPSTVSSSLDFACPD